uniref:Uncharacterized protein n=1 Tax=Arundo donax TaxID=35708 RepID=A0A0A8Z5P4_ARUDO
MPTPSRWSDRDDALADVPGKQPYDVDMRSYSRSNTKNTWETNNSTNPWISRRR